MKNKRAPLSRSAQLWFYLGCTMAMVGLVLLGYRWNLNLALPAFLFVLLLVTLMGAWQERSERQKEAARQNPEAEESPGDDRDRFFEP